MRKDNLVHSMTEEVIVPRVAYRKLAENKGRDILRVEDLENFVADCVSANLHPQTEIAKLTKDSD